MHVCALKVASEDILETVPAIDDVSRQMIQLGPAEVGQVNREELDDEKFIICPACLASEVVVLQLHVGFSFTIVLDDITWRSKVLWEASVAHGAFERFWPRLFRAKVHPS
jgi:hypothetical protein